MTGTPYDTGARLEPRLWIEPGKLIRRDDEDAYGRVDFDNDMGATEFTVWAEPAEDGKVILHVIVLAADAVLIEVPS